MMGFILNWLLKITDNGWKREQEQILRDQRYADDHIFPGVLHR